MINAPEEGGQAAQVRVISNPAAVGEQSISGMQTVPTPATGAGFAPPPVVPVYAPGQEPPPTPKPPKKSLIPKVPPAPPVTSLLVTETPPTNMNGTSTIIGGK